MSQRRSVLVVGDTVLDRDLEGTVERVAPDVPVPVVDQRSLHSRAGGAGLAATLAAADRCEVTLLTALAADAAGYELAGLLAGGGVTVLDIGSSSPTAEKLRVSGGGHPLLRIDRGGGSCGAGRVGPAVAAAIAAAAAVLVSDYGLGVAAHPQIRAALERAAADKPVVWDPHRRGPVPVAGVALATPNRAEARLLAPDLGGAATVAERAELLRRRWAARNVAVTLGADGAVLAADGAAPVAIPASRVAGSDPCGAGDRFASRCVQELADERTVAEAVAVSVACASDFVARGGARGGARPGLDAAFGGPAGELAERVRAGGGTVVATGGCFDLVHAGHVRTLEAARGLGDCLIVCLNSDASTTRLKGPSRPLVNQADRAAVLCALGCVDAVAVFDEDTPDALLRTIRPHVWVKGGDYEGRRLPEARVLESWGGRTVFVPFLRGRSTTRIVAEAVARTQIVNA